MRSLAVRAYALLIMLVVLWAFYTAVSYLVRQVFFPAPVPREFLAWQGRLDAADLRRPAVPGITRSAARAPLGHYHGVQTWMQHDPHNGCTQEGCHSPLPHQRTHTVRAFANLHATFLNCTACHVRPARRPATAVWIDNETGRVQDGPPPILGLIDFLQAHRGKVRDDPRAVHGEVIGRLDRIVALGGEQNVLSHLRVQLHTAQPGSPVWRHAIEQLIEELPRHLRGEYGAKIALGDGEQFRRRNRELVQLAGQYRKLPAGSAQAGKIHSQIHASVVAAPEGCLACHGPASDLLDLEALGYPADRAARLRDLPLARMGERIRSGQPFRLPGLMEDAP